MLSAPSVSLVAEECIEGLDLLQLWADQVKMEALGTTCPTATKFKQDSRGWKIS